MATQEVEFDGTLWFFTQASSEKAREIRQNPQINASYVSVEDHHYVSLTGHASVVQDREKMQELWSPAYRVWFPQGQDDPDLALLKVDVEQAEYWDMLSSSMVNLLDIDCAMRCARSSRRPRDRSPRTGQALVFLSTRCEQTGRDRAPAAFPLHAKESGSGLPFLDKTGDGGQGID